MVGLGAEAEHGLSTGVTAFGLVRSGTNQYAGLGEFWTTPSDWVATNTEALRRPSSDSSHPRGSIRTGTPNGQIGGPLRTTRSGSSPASTHDE